jgi:hypothetical protein
MSAPLAAPGAASTDQSREGGGLVARGRRSSWGVAGGCSHHLHGVVVEGLGLLARALRGVRHFVSPPSPQFLGPLARSPLIWSVSISSSLCFPVWGALQPPDRGMGRDAVTASVVAIRSKLAQLKREIQSGRLAYIKVSARADHVAGISRRGLWVGLLN